MSITTSRRAVVVVAGVVAAGGIATGAAIAATGANASGSPAKSGSGSSSAPKPPAGAPAPGGPAGPGGPHGQYDADGTVTAASDSSLTVRNAFGKTSTYALTSATKVHSGPGSSASRSDLDTGDHVTVHGTKASSGVRATDVDIHLPHLDGSVSGVSGSSITITDHDGFTRTIDTTSSTKYTVDGKSSSSSAVTSGRVVHAEGSVDSNGTTLDATRIAVLTKQPTPPSPPANAPKPPSSNKSGSTKPGSNKSGSSSGSSSSAPANGSGHSS